jgi:hypothetical protein
VLPHDRGRNGRPGNDAPPAVHGGDRPPGAGSAIRPGDRGRLPRRAASPRLSRQARRGGGGRGVPNLQGSKTRPLDIDLGLLHNRLVAFPATRKGGPVRQEHPERLMGTVAPPLLPCRPGISKARTGTSIRALPSRDHRPCRLLSPRSSASGVWCCARHLYRLEGIEADLILRRKHAEAEGWLGEIEGSATKRARLGVRRGPRRRGSLRRPRQRHHRHLRWPRHRREQRRLRLGRRRAQHD